jgi:hypothetical protein
MRARAIVRELVKQLMEADADDEERRQRRPDMRKILKKRKYPDEDDDDPIDADPMSVAGLR